VGTGVGSEKESPSFARGKKAIAIRAEGAHAALRAAPALAFFLPARAYDSVSDEETDRGPFVRGIPPHRHDDQAAGEGSRWLAMEVVSIGPVDLSDAQRIDASISDG
jgi:hypothetical protein